MRLLAKQFRKVRIFLPAEVIYMDFCEDCGSSRTRLDKNNKKIVCKTCGHEHSISLNDITKSPVNAGKESNEKILVLDKKYTESKYKVNHKCPYCDFNEAYVQHISPRWGDEDNLSIYTCTKCGKSDREGFSH